MLPETVVVAQALRSDVRWKEVPNDAVEPGWSVYDIGSAAAATFASHIGGARTILWNGPMGVFETPPFHEGTMAIAHSMAAATKSGSVTVVGGGDSAAAMNMAGLEREVSHVSTGGGAALKLLEGKVLPAIAALDDV